MSRKEYTNVSLEPEAVEALRRMRARMTGLAVADVSLSAAVLVAERMTGTAEPRDVMAALRVVTSPQVAR